MAVSQASLKNLVIRGSAWQLGGHAAGQIIRLARSLILTRLLFPEAFGVMALVWVVMYGLEMLSDVGLGPAIIRDKRGDDPVFLRTAWTIQALRGGVLWIVACLLAYPMAVFYEEPQLAVLIPVAGFTAVLGGFSSVSLFTCRREMQFGRLTTLVVLHEVVGIAACVAWALADPSVWALVGGALIGRLFMMVASHVFLPGVRCGFAWEYASIRVLFGFGKWIFLSSCFYFLATQADRLLLGHYLGMAELGVYSIAIMLAESMQTGVLAINHGVLLPAYAKLLHEDRARMRAAIARSRAAADALIVLPIAAVIVLGDIVVGTLYDERYASAGWMLQILCLRLVMSATLSNSESCLTALGHPQYAFAQNAARALWIIVAVPLGWRFFGVQGAVWAVALFEIPVLAILWSGMIKHGMFNGRSELRSLGFAGLGLLAGAAVSLLWS